MAQPPSARTKVFISYSHKDKIYLDELQNHLTYIQQLGLKDVFWADTQIKSGTVWFDQIKSTIAAAKVAIFLVSPTFLSSEFIRLNEVPPLLKAAEARQALILSVILQPSLFHRSPLAAFQTVNSPDRPLADLSQVERNKVWVQLVERVIEVLENTPSPSGPRKAKTREEWIAEGIAHRLADRFSKAVAAFDQALALDPDEASPLFGKGTALWDVGRKEEARALYKRASSMPIRTTLGHYMKGSALYQLKQYAESLAAHEQALRMDQRNGYAWSGKSATLCELKRYTEALVASERALQLNPKFENAWHNKGRALHGLQRYEEALAAYERALQLNPKMEYAWSNKSAVLNALKRYPEALVAAERAIELDPKFSFAYQQKSAALSGLIEQCEESLAAAERAIKLNPHDTASSQQKSAALSALKRYQKEQVATEQAIVYEPGELVYLVHGKDAGREAWHYVLVDKAKMHLFKQTLKAGGIDVSKYGKILYSGWGKDPPPEIAEAIKKQFG